VLVSATLTPAVLAACSQWCPNLQPVVVGPDATAAALDDAAAAHMPMAPQSQHSSLEVTQQAPQWGWDTNSRQADRGYLALGVPLAPVEHRSSMACWECMRPLSSTRDSCSRALFHDVWPSCNAQARSCSRPPALRQARRCRRTSGTCMWSHHPTAG
jgi:hypothetical protein